MCDSITLEETNKFFNDGINWEIKELCEGQPHIIEMVKKCVNHIKCLCCLDTRRLLFESESWFGGTYEEFSCPACTGSRDRKDSHHQIYHCKVNGRQVPYNGGDRKIGYSRVQQLCEIYKKDYQQTDLLIEEKERKLKEAELAAEAMRVENERLIRQAQDAEEENKPHWEFMDDKELRKEINSAEVEVNISQLVEDVSRFMATAAGNLAALPLFLKDLKLTLKYYWGNENSKNNSVSKIKDDLGDTVYIKFEYKKITEETKVSSGFFRTNVASKKEFLWVSYFIAKPTKGNKAAEKICEDLMNTTIQTVINKLNKQIKN